MNQSLARRKVFPVDLIREVGLAYFQVWVYQMAHGSVSVGDSLDFTQRLDNQRTVQTDAGR